MTRPPTLNQVYANSAQVVDISKALEIAYQLIELSQLTKGEDQEISDLWKFRSFLFLNRACELSCLPVHKRIVETSNGLEEAWYTFVYVPQNESNQYYGYYSTKQRIQFETIGSAHLVVWSTAEKLSVLKLLEIPTTRISLMILSV